MGFIGQRRRKDILSEMLGYTTSVKIKTIIAKLEQYVHGAKLQLPLN